MFELCRLRGERSRKAADLLVKRQDGIDDVAGLRAIRCVGSGSRDRVRHGGAHGSPGRFVSAGATRAHRPRRKTHGKSTPVTNHWHKLLRQVIRGPNCGRVVAIGADALVVELSLQAEESTLLLVIQRQRTVENQTIGACVLRGQFEFL